MWNPNTSENPESHLPQGLDPYFVGGQITHANQSSLFLTGWFTCQKGHACEWQQSWAKINESHRALSACVSVHVCMPRSGTPNTTMPKNKEKRREEEERQEGRCNPLHFRCHEGSKMESGTKRKNNVSLCPETGVLQKQCQFRHLINSLPRKPLILLVQECFHLHQMHLQEKRLFLQCTKWAYDICQWLAHKSTWWLTEDNF